MLNNRFPVIGLGYIGLPTAALIARSGSRVLGIDVSQRVVDTINSGKVHIEEVDLDGLVQGVVARACCAPRWRSNPATCSSSAVADPWCRENNAPDISLRLNAAAPSPRCWKIGDPVILESTSPVGTTEAMRQPAC